MPTNITQEIEITCADQRVVLRGDGTVFLPGFDALLVADLHLGKSASFRAGGVPVPEGLDATTLSMLATSVQETNAAHVLLLGDLIHNRDSMTSTLVSLFADWRNEKSKVKFTLVRGNHDRHVAAFPADWTLTETNALELGPFQLVHEVPASPLAGGDTFRFGGHWHPVVRVGSGADRMRLPCFVVSDRHVTLPAFGPFKGGMNQVKKNATQFYPIGDGMIWRI